MHIRVAHFPRAVFVFIHGSEHLSNILYINIFSPRFQISARALSVREGLDFMWAILLVLRCVARSFLHRHS